MLLIDRPVILFYIVAMDFIVALSISVEGFNSLLIIIYKFLKRVLLILGKII